MRRLNALALVAIVVFAACGGGTREEVGTLVGFSGSFGLDEAQSGVIEDIDFGGILILELDDGTEVRAQAAQAFVTDELTGGDRFRIEFDEETEVWTVVERLNE